MIDRDEAEALLEAEGHLFLTSKTGGGQDAGAVLRVYLDEYSGWPSFATITANLPDQETLVALHAAEHREQGDGIQVPYDEDKINRAPTVTAGQDLSISEEDVLFEYYGVPIDGVTPVVEHLGSALVPHDTADGSDSPDVVEHDVDHPSS